MKKLLKAAKTNSKNETSSNACNKALLENNVIFVHFILLLCSAAQKTCSGFIFDLFLIGNFHNYAQVHSKSNMNIKVTSNAFPLKKSEKFVFS